jgi:polysaccharide biosynthesis transport protein
MDSSLIARAAAPIAMKRGRKGRQGNEFASNPERDIIVQRRGETVLEHFRRIYLALQPVDPSEVMPVIGVTSSVGREGRSTIAAGIAAAMAADLEAPIVLVEADLESPGMHHVLGIGEQPGICEYLRGEVELATVLRQIADRFYVLPSGDARGEAARLARQLVSGDLLMRLQSSGAVPVLDLPPVLASSYGVLACSMADTLAFAVRSGQTTTTQVKEALSRLPEEAVRGIVLNGAEPQLPGWLRGRG